MRLLSGRPAQISRRQGLQLDRLPQARAQGGGEALEVVVDRTGIARQPAVGTLEPGEPPAALLTHDTALDPAGGGNGPKGGFVHEERHRPTVLSGPAVGLNESGRRLQPAAQQENLRPARDAEEITEEAWPRDRNAGRRAAARRARRPLLACC